MGCDISDVTWGLPEITRAFLVAEKMTPRGTLFTNHTKPPGLEGLYTVRNITANTGLTTGYQVDASEGGWSRFVVGEGKGRSCSTYSAADAPNSPCSRTHVVSGRTVITLI